MPVLAETVTRIRFYKPNSLIDVPYLLIRELRVTFSGVNFNTLGQIVIVRDKYPHKCQRERSINSKGYARSRGITPPTTLHAMMAPAYTQ